MAFVKLDCGILDSTLWIERECREVFITALLMAKPREFTDPIDQIAVRSTEPTGWSAPPGWYGFVEAAGPGIIRRAGIGLEPGLVALERMGNPDHESRTPDHEGRRLIRVDGGFLILNFQHYRDKDHTAAERSARYRAKSRSDNVTPQRDATIKRDTVTPVHPNVTEVEVEAEQLLPPLPPPSGGSSGNTLPEPQTPAPSGQWWKSEAGILAKCQSLKLEAKPGETLESFKARIEATAAGIKPQPSKPSARVTETAQRIADQRATIVSAVGMPDSLRPHRSLTKLISQASELGLDQIEGESPDSLEERVRQATTNASSKPNEADTSHASH